MLVKWTHKIANLSRRDVQVVKPYECGRRGSAGRLTNFWNEHPVGPCPGRGDASGGMGSDSDGALQPKEEYARVIASTNHLKIPCFVMGPSLAWLPKPTTSCSDFPYEAETSMYTLRALTGQSRDSWLPVEGESVESDMTWALKHGEHRGRKTQPWFQDDLGVVKPEFQASRIDVEGLQVSYSLDRCQY